MLAKVPRQELIITCNNRHILYAANKSGCIKVIELIMGLFEDINIALDPDQKTIAHIVALYGLRHLVEPLWKVGVDFTRRCKAGDTAVSLAIRNDDSKLLKTILKYVLFEEHRIEGFSQIVS